MQRFWLDGLFSFLLLALVGLCCLRILPGLGLSRPQIRLKTPAAVNLTIDQARYIYVWDGDLIRIGEVTMISPGNEITVTIFPEHENTVRDYTGGVLFHNDIMNLWKITASSSKQKLLSSTQMLLSRGFGSLMEFLESDYFKQTYLPRMQTSMGDAFKVAMQSEQTKTRIKALYSEAEDIVLKTFGDDAIPMMIDALVATVSSQVGMSPAKIMSFLSTGELELDFKEELIQRFKEHPDFERNMTATINALVRSPALTEFTQSVAVDTLQALAQDEHFTDLLLELATDKRLQERLRGLSSQTAETFLEVVHALVTRPDGKTLDPFAARVISSMLFDSEEWLLLLLKDDLRTLMVDLEFPEFAATTAEGATP
jgi:hypothetical protein